MSENNIGEIILGRNVGYRFDLLAEGRVVVEVEAVDKLTKSIGRSFSAISKLGGYRLGYLLNFNVPRMKDGIIRMVSSL